MAIASPYIAVQSERNVARCEGVRSGRLISGRGSQIAGRRLAFDATCCLRPATCFCQPVDDQFVRPVSALPRRAPGDESGVAAAPSHVQFHRRRRRTLPRAGRRMRRRPRRDGDHLRAGLRLRRDGGRVEPHGRRGPHRRSDGRRREDPQLEMDAASPMSRRPRSSTGSGTSPGALTPSVSLALPGYSPSVVFSSSKEPILYFQVTNMPAVDFTRPPGNGPASVTPRCSG